MGCSPTVRPPGCSGLMSRSRSKPTTKPTRSSMSGALLRKFARPARASSALSASSRISSRARSILAASSAPPACRSSSAAFTSAAASRCCRNCRSDLQGGARSRHHALRRRGRGPHGSAAARCRQRRARSRSTTILHDLPDLRIGVAPCLPPDASPRASSDTMRLVRRRPRLPVPMQLLHDHQRAGPQVALPLGRRRRAADPRTTALQGVTRFFITDDNFARNKNWEAILDRLIGCASARASLQVRDPGRYAVPQDSRLHREGGARRLQLRRSSASRTSIPESLIGAKKRQNKIWEYREMLQAWRDARVITWAGYILGFPERYAGDDRARHRDHQERAADRHPGVLLSDAVAGLGRSPEAVRARGSDGTRHEQV